MRETVQIRMMGEFSIRTGNHETTNMVAKTRKGVALMEYLILNHGKAISKQRLLSLLWSGYQHTNPESSLKVMVSRLRKMLNEIYEGLGDCIQSERGAYRWVSAPNVTVDVLELMEIFDRLGSEKTEKELFSLYDRLIRLYQGDLYLTGDITSGTEYEAALHNEYLNAVYDFIEILMGRGEYVRIIDICTKALRIDEMDERLHMEMMQAQVNANRLSDAMAQYRKLSDINSNYLDVEPSEEMQNFYSNLVQTGRALRFSLDSLKREMLEENPSRGAHVCAYEEFRQYYRLTAPTLERLGFNFFIGMIMLGELDEKTETERAVIDPLMEDLIQILQENLRRGDVVTRYTPAIAAVMLPTVNQTTGNMVMERIRQIFLAKHPDCKLPFHYRLGEIGKIQ